MSLPSWFLLRNVKTALTGRRISILLAIFFFFAAALQAAPALSQTLGEADTKPGQDTESRNKALVQASFDAWKAGTGGPFDLLTEDATWTIVGRSMASKTYRSREAFMSEVIRPFTARMSVALKPTVLNLYADGATVIVFFDASGTARDGKPYTNTYAWFLEMNAGKVVKTLPSLTVLSSTTFGGESFPQRSSSETARQ